MNQLRLLALLLLPSVLSLTLVLLGALGLLLAANWSYAVHDPVLYPAFYGPDGVATTFSQHSSSFLAYMNALSLKYISYNIFVFMVAVSVAGVMYSVLKTLSRVMSSAHETIAGMQIADERLRRRNEFEAGVRLVIRIFALVIWFLYWTLSFKVILPFALLTSRWKFEELWVDNAWVSALTAVIIVALALYIHVVFMRLMALRPRLFGGDSEITAARLH